jgi:flagellar biosynthetic protein FliO
LLSAQSGTNTTEQNTSTTESSQTDDFLTSKFDLSTMDSNSTFLPDSNSSELFYRTMLAVLIVIVLGISAIYVTKKILPKIANTSGKEIHIVETVHLGPRKSVHLIEIGNHRFLIGSTSENISKLADLSQNSVNISTHNNRD